MTYDIAVVPGDSVPPEQQEFINHWSHSYFGDVSVSKDRKSAPVHWRLLLQSDGNLLSHVAISELAIELDGQRLIAGSIGGLLTPTHLQGKGYASALMDRAEEFIFADLKLSMGILFCLSALVPFYARRGWIQVTRPVTLQQQSGSIEWGAEVMVFGPNEQRTGNHSIHVPNQTGPTSDRGGG